MPQLPFAGYTASTGGIGVPGRAGTGRDPTGADTGGVAALGRAHVGRGLQDLGQSIQQFGQAVDRHFEEKDLRTVQVESIKLGTAFDKEITDTITSGGDFDALQLKYSNAFGELGDKVSTKRGSAAAELAMLKAEDMIQGRIGAARADRTKIETKQQTADFINLVGNSLVTNPDNLPASMEQMGQYIDTFGGLSPQDRNTLKQSAYGDLAQAAASGLLIKDPQRLHDIIVDGGGIEHLTPAQTASYLSRANAALEKAANAANSTDEYQKLLTRQKWEAEAVGRVLTNEEAPQMIAEGLTAAQVDGLQAKSRDAEQERLALVFNSDAIRNGIGNSLSEKSYQTAVDHMVTEIAGDADDPERMINVRVTLAAKNGREDSKLKAIIQAGPVGEENAFALGYEARRQLMATSPGLYDVQTNADTKALYNIYDYLTTRLGLPQQTARNQVLSVKTRRAEVDKRLHSKDVEKAVTGAAEDLARQGDTLSQVPAIRSQIEDRAAYYMALNELMTADAAIELARTDFEGETRQDSTGFRVSRRGEPPMWQQAEGYARNVVLRRDLENAGMTLPGGGENLKEIYPAWKTEADKLLSAMAIIPNGDGTATVTDPNTGKVVFPRWDMRRAQAEWHEEVFAKEEAEKAGRVEEYSRAKQESRKAAFTGSYPIHGGRAKRR